MPRKENSPNKNTMKWIFEKLNEHDTRLQEIFQLLRELKREIDMNNQRIILDIMQQDDESPEEETENA